MNTYNAELTQAQRTELFSTLKDRFESNMNRHRDIEWKKVQAKLEESVDKLKSLYEMEKTGGEPDVIDFDKKMNEFTFYDCSAESPKGRRNVCYDAEALEARKTFKPKDSAVGMATAMGVDILNEEQYQQLQKLGNFDIKTSSWIKTPLSIRKLGGALFADYRYDAVFIYHNGAQSYYSSRGFRACLKV